MIMLSWVFAAIAILVLLIASLGLLTLPDALSRQHAATKAATLGIMLLGFAILFSGLSMGWDNGWLIRLAVLQVFLALTLPLASHALARAALAEATTSALSDERHGSNIYGSCKHDSGKH